MTSVLEELVSIHEASFRLTESLASALRNLEAGSDKHVRQQMITTLQLAKGELSTAQQYIQAVVQSLDEERAVLQSKIMSSSRPPEPLSATTSGNKIYNFRFASGGLVTSAVIGASNQEVKLLPDWSFENLHPVFKERPFFPRPFGIQPFLITLLAQTGCSVFVDGNEPGGPATRSGFTTGAIVALASKLLDHLDRGLVKKAIIIPRKSKYEEVTKICESVVPAKVQVINLLGLVPRPTSLSDNLPRLIVCSISDIVSRAVETKDCTHLVWDDYDGSDMVVEYGFTGLHDVVYRGPPRLAHTTLLPKKSLYRCRLYSFTRSVNCFDVQPFSLSRDVEGLFLSLPAGKNILFTTQTNVFIAGVKIVAALSDVPMDADHLVIAEVPVTEDGIRVILREAYAKIVTFICQPTSPKVLIHQAMRAEGLEAPALPSEARSEASPAICVPVIRY
jgi:hypothetical protein